MECKTSPMWVRKWELQRGVAQRDLVQARKQERFSRRRNPSCQERRQRQLTHCPWFPRGHKHGGQRRESYISAVTKTSLQVPAKEIFFSAWAGPIVIRAACLESMRNAQTRAAVNDRIRPTKSHQRTRLCCYCKTTWHQGMPVNGDRTRSRETIVASTLCSIGATHTGSVATAVIFSRIPA